MQEVVELLKAHMWFAASVAITPIVLRLVKAKESWLFSKLPEGLKFLPAATILYLAAFAESAAQGAGWEAAALNALVLTVMGAPMAIGGYHMAKKAAPQPKADDGTGPSSKRGTLAVLAASLLAAPLALSGCIAPAVAAAWLPAVLAALSAAGTLLDEVDHWVERFRPAVPADVAAKLDQFLADARAALKQTADLAGKGAEFQVEAEKAYQGLRKLLDDGFALLASVGLYEPSSERLTAPATMRSIDGSVQEVESMPLKMPPARLAE